MVFLILGDSRDVGTAKVLSILMKLIDHVFYEFWVSLML